MELIPPSYSEAVSKPRGKAVGRYQQWQCQKEGPNFGHKLYMPLQLQVECSPATGPFRVSVFLLTAIYASVDCNIQDSIRHSTYRVAWAYRVACSLGEEMKAQR